MIDHPRRFLGTTTHATRRNHDGLSKRDDCGVSVEIAGLFPRMGAAEHAAGRPRSRFLNVVLNMPL
jgi:hypothetical protein